MKLYIKDMVSKVLSDKNFGEIFIGSVAALFSRGGAVGLSLLISLFVSKAYGEGVLGKLSIIQSILMVVTIFSVFGLNISALRIIPEQIVKKSYYSAFLAYKEMIKIVFIMAFVVSMCVVFFSNKISTWYFSGIDDIFCVYIVAFALFFKSFYDLNVEVVRSFKSIKLYSFLLLSPNFSMFIFLILNFFIVQNESGVFYSLVFSWSLVSMFGMIITGFYFYKRVDRTSCFERLGTSEILNISFPMMTTASINLLIAQIGLLVLGYYSSPEDVGHYSVAVKLSTLIAFVAQSVNSMAAPKFAEIYSRNNMVDLFIVAKKTTKMIFFLSLPLLLFMVLWGEDVLLMFGDGFCVVYFPLLLLLLGQFVNSFCGPVGYFMDMTGNQTGYRNIIFVSCLFNFLLCMFLVPKIGIYGATISSLVCTVVLNVLSFCFLLKKYGKTIAYVPFL